MSIAPQLMKNNLTHLELISQYENTSKDSIFQECAQEITKYTGFKAKFTIIHKQRSVSTCSKFILLFKRNLLYLFRHPRVTRVAAIYNGLYLGALFAVVFRTMFFDIPDPLNPNYDDEIRKKTTNWVGFS